jgi:hypothetical protein
MLERTSKKRPRDLNQLAAAIVEEATREVDQEEIATSETGEPKPEKNPAAVELGRRGGKKGGPARAAKLTPEQRSEIARKAAAKRWEKS